MTFERPPYVMAAAARGQKRDLLTDEGICWHPVTYRGRGSLASALYDGVRAVVVGAITLVRHHPRFIHTRTSVPAALGLLLARGSGRRFLYDADSELSEEYADGGHWRRGSVAFRLLSGLERLCRSQADTMIVLTEHLRKAFADRGVRAPVTVIPCCVDVSRFRFSEADRQTRRRDLGLGREPLLIYVGKTGPRYLVDEMMAFTKTLARRAEDVRLLVLTHEAREAFDALATRHALEPWRVIVRRAEPDDVPSWLSAADAGLAFIRPAPSERGSSPIKMSEYLANGLPVVTTPGIGDISGAIAECGLGVVVADSSEPSFDSAAEDLLHLWRDPGQVRERCAAWARSAVDVRTATTRYAQVYESLLAS